MQLGPETPSGLDVPYMIDRMTEGVAATEPPVLIERAGAVLEVTLNRPHARNALDVATMSALKRLWHDVEALQGVRCVIVTGAGPGFCAGADMELLDSDRPDAGGTVEEELAFLPGDAVEAPVIAAVNGVCAGGGLHFVADADIVIAAEGATFLDPHVSVGQVSALEPLSLLLSMRRDRLYRMVLLGSHERLSAAEAHDAGLVSELLPADRLMPRARELASLIARNSPAAVRASRRVLRGFERALLHEHLEAGWQEIRAHWQHPDASEGPRAFTARREPRWQGDE